MQTTQNTTPPSPNTPPAGPRHWVGVEELEASYWADPQVQEKRGQEFFEKPVELIDRIDRMDKAGLARREFLTVMGASMALSGLACARRPVHKIIPYVVKPEEIVPGIANVYASTYSSGGELAGILIKTREGRPIKLEGNPQHPANRGVLSARAQASLLDLYDPDRLQASYVRDRKTGTKSSPTWSELDRDVVAGLKRAAGRGKVVFLTGSVVSETSRKLLKEAQAGMGSSQHIELEAAGFDDVSAGQEASYGEAVLPRYRFGDADLIVSIGGDFLGSWPQSAEHAKDWSKRRKVTSQKPSQAEQAQLWVFEAPFTVTGANADYRYPVRAGDEYKVALALAHELLVKRKQGKFSSDASVASALSGYSAEAVARDLGLVGGAATLQKAADRLWSKRGKGIVVAGGPQVQGEQAMALQVAVNLLNSALDNEGALIDGDLRAPQGGWSALESLTAQMKDGKVSALVTCGVNPLYALPPSLGFEAALAKVPLVIQVTDHDDETAQKADYVLAKSHALESWGDATWRRGVVSVQQPAITPLHATRSWDEVVFGWIKAGLGSSSSVTAASDWHEYLRANWRETHFKAGSFAGSFDSFWEGVLRTGVFGSPSGGRSARSFKTASLKNVPTFRAQAKDAVTLAIYASNNMGNGAHANNAWLQELPDPITSVTWDNYLSVGVESAKLWNLKQDDVVEVSMPNGRAELPVYVQPGLHPQSVAVAMGYGRRNVGKVGDGAGVDVMPLVGLSKGLPVFSGQSVKLRKTGRIYRLAATQWHTVSENRPIINDVTLGEYRADPSVANHTDPHLRLDEVPTLWPRHEYKGNRWGMSIDLTSCTGCGACMVACQAENNVPVVGRDQVRNSRHMAWIKIDRYYSGDPSNPDVVFQPMLCQHCENAPCETVCPVAATVHDDEGMNLQVYNRCVGTRYCQNNCPYKVRRFNFFDHWKSYEGTLNMAWNPDVTVRTRGIMEKCSFCVQRIRDAKDLAKDGGDKLKDGDFKTACQQTCPTEAISFGNVNDPSSQVSRMQAHPAAFRVLEVLNTRPAVSYLSKIRNKEATGAKHGDAHS